MPVKSRMGTRRDVQTCVIVGLVMASIYAMYAIGLYALEGPRPFEQNGTSIAVVLATYYAAGVIGGGVVGLLMPFTASIVGSAAVGVLVAFISFFGIAIANEGPAWRWSSAVWVQLLIFAFLFGTTLSLGWRNITGRR